jgi:hypothetical protein
LGQGRAFLENIGGGVGIVPEILVGYLCFKFFESVFFASQVKDNLRADLI